MMLPTPLIVISKHTGLNGGCPDTMRKGTLGPSGHRPALKCQQRPSEARPGGAVRQAYGGRTLRSTSRMLWYQPVTVVSMRST